MADVKITFEEVKTKANEIHTCNVNLDQALKDIKTNIAQLNQLQEPTNSAILWNKREPQKPRGFNHSR